MENELNSTQITMDLILETFKSFSDRKQLKDIKDSVIAILHPNELLIAENERKLIDEKVAEIIAEDKKLGDQSYLCYSNRKYYKRKNKRNFDSPKLMQNSYTGTAGECAVISELLFAGYNANRMMLDEGVDIIAVKDNIYYYVQVKTTILNDNKIYVKIGLDRFMQYRNQVRYVIVARYSDKGVNKNMFFTFTPDQINEGIHNGYIKRGVDCVSIKIAFNPKNGKPYLYDDSHEHPCDYNWNKEDLLNWQ